MSEPDLIVPAAEANRAFSKLLRAARSGKRITITSHGEPVAELIPAGESARQAAELVRRAAALAELEAHWASLKPVVAAWTRDEIYDHD